jgi:thioredoxin-related protein
MREKSTARIALNCISIFITLAMLWILPAETRAEAVAWTGYSEIFDEAQDTGRHVYLYFFSDNCGYCQLMDNKTFTSGRVVDYMKDTFVAARIRAERSPRLLRKYLVRGFPTSWFLTPGGKGIMALPGYLSPEQFSTVLKYIGGGHYRTQSLREYLE